ncbi:restriction endonuclease [Desulfonatronum thiodismutans]|uniref:restriction endonuclease n=1 Tax=Desulfonatronum thiodismutans TaxID=159290 RepID=UPI00190F6E6E|nr:restriction endonuclease [Desulfonatronum thiodismutans]
MNTDKKKRKAEFVQWMGPLLDALRELGDTATPQEASDLIAQRCGVPDAKKEELTESGIARFHNQVCWARQYLVWEGLISSARRGIWTLTERGKKTRLTEAEGRDIFKKWVNIHTQRRKAKEQGASCASETQEDISAKPPEAECDDPLVGQGDAPTEMEEVKLLDVLRRMTPKGFEKFCKYLLRVYGFEKVEVTPDGKDGGVDGYGVLQLNPFVSFKVIFQCKRYTGTVSRAQVGDLRNAMLGRADKGIMITTGIFSEDAKREATREGAPPIELIDGNRLVAMLEKEEIGVVPRTVYDIDYAFFRAYLPDKPEPATSGNGG